MSLQQLFCPSCHAAKMGRVDESKKPLPTSICSDCGSFLKVSEVSSNTKPLVVEEVGPPSSPPQEDQNDNEEEEGAEERETQEAVLISSSVFTFDQVRELMQLVERQLMAAKPNNVPNIVINLDEKLVNRGESALVVPHHIQEQAVISPRKTIKTVERDSSGLIVRVIESEG